MKPWLKFRLGQNDRNKILPGPLVRQIHELHQCIEYTLTHCLPAVLDVSACGEGSGLEDAAMCEGDSKDRHTHV